MAKRKLRHKRGTICYLWLNRMAYQKVGMKVVPTVVPKGGTKGIHYGTLNKQKLQLLFPHSVFYNSVSTTKGILRQLVRGTTLLDVLIENLCKTCLFRRPTG